MSNFINTKSRSLSGFLYFYHFIHSKYYEENVFQCLIIVVFMHGYIH